MCGIELGMAVNEDPLVTLLPINKKKYHGNYPYVEYDQDCSTTIPFFRSKFTEVIQGWARFFPKGCPFWTKPNCQAGTLCPNPGKLDQARSGYFK